MENPDDIQLRKPPLHGAEITMTEFHDEALDMLEVPHFVFLDFPGHIELLRAFFHNRRHE